MHTYICLSVLLAGNDYASEISGLFSVTTHAWFVPFLPFYILLLIISPFLAARGKTVWLSGSRKFRSESSRTFDQAFSRVVAGTTDAPPVSKWLLTSLQSWENQDASAAVPLPLLSLSFSPYPFISFSLFLPLLLFLLNSSAPPVEREKSFPRLAGARMPVTWDRVVMLWWIWGSSKLLDSLTRRKCVMKWELWVVVGSFKKERKRNSTRT